MGQLITRPEGGIEKTDINVYYATYGEGDTYAMDGNEEYYTAEENCGHMDKEDAALSKVANFANFVFKKCVLQDPEKGQQTKSRCVCIFMVCIVMFVCIGGGTAFYFLHIVPSSIGLSQNVTNSSLTRSSLHLAGSSIQVSSLMFLQMGEEERKGVTSCASSQAATKRVHVQTSKNVGKRIHGCLFPLRQ